MPHLEHDEWSKIVSLSSGNAEQQRRARLMTIRFVGLIIKHGDLEILKQLHTSIDNQILTNHFGDAAGWNQIAIMNWMYTNGYYLANDGDIWTSAMASENMDAMNWLHDHNHPFDAGRFWWVTHNASIDCLKFLVDRGYPYDKADLRDGLIRGLKSFGNYFAEFTSSIKRYAECSEYIDSLP